VVTGNIIHNKSKEFIPVFEEASSYKLTESFEFITVNCADKELCNFYKANRYPTIKVFLKGEEIDGEPGRDLETLLDFIERLSSDTVQKVRTVEELNQFRNKHSDSFILAYDNTETEYYKCIAELANEKYKQYFYIAAIEASVYNSTSVKVPALIVNTFLNV
jgi:hypothetical protein